VIRSFRNKALRELFETGRSAKVPSELRRRVTERLDALHAALALADLSRPGLHCHPLKGASRYAISVNGPWRITFAWVAPDAFLVDLEQYH
jgi:proteic killer suppression protein